MPYLNVYSIELRQTSISTAKTLLQWKAGTLGGALVIRGWVGVSGVSAPLQQTVALVRKTAAATVTAGALGTNIFDAYATGVAPSASLGTAATGINASAEGTDGDVPYQDDFDVLSGWLYVPVPEERIFIPAGGILSLKFPVAPGSALSIDCGLTIQELG